ncbi:hypothetical protein [Pleionea sp. CnH1-48]|uniref:hypothetical protein n=1 Tax=Pleionea sp. CnH1-48 TaxID=2954494 RepID=UPI002096A17B|nr:hypothetical protein [Pleionea sp. CnH1-48]MCO7223301.1 hypothetical protein [Pleionea sp. CnH1-48]
MNVQQNFTFSERRLVIEALINKKILASQSNQGNLYVFLDDLSIGVIDTQTGDFQQVYRFDANRFPTDAEFHLHNSADDRYVALTCTKRTTEHTKAISAGAIISVTQQQEVMVLSNGDYHTENTPFPICFIEHEGNNLIVHATDWNRLDITNLETGELLTPRDLKEAPELLDDEDILMTEWPGELKPSPNQDRIATIGWVWHPIGHAYSFHLKRWLEGHTWESDGCSHQRSYAVWDYFWDAPFFWIDNERLCIWGHSKEDKDGFPKSGASIFDANKNEVLLLSFEGPTLDIFFYDTYLFSGIRRGEQERLGLSVWSIEDGSLLCEKLGLLPDDYIQTSREFVSFNESGEILFTQWYCA